MKSVLFIPLQEDIDGGQLFCFFFFLLLDIAGINAQIIFTFNNPSHDVLRGMFLREVGESLVKPGIRKRINLQFLTKHL